MFSCMIWDEKCLWQKKEREQEKIFLQEGSWVDGRWGEEKGQMVSELVFVLMTGILMEK